MDKKRNYRVVTGRGVEYFSNLTPLANYVKTLSGDGWIVTDLVNKVDITGQFRPLPKPAPPVDDVTKQKELEAMDWIKEFTEVEPELASGSDPIGSEPQPEEKIEVVPKRKKDRKNARP